MRQLREQAGVGLGLVPLADAVTHWGNTAGLVSALYDGDLCLGGGRIDAPGTPAGPLADTRDAVGALA